MYSPQRNWYRVETHLKDVKVEADDLSVRLLWVVGEEEEEGDYKCEITYLAVTRCPVVRLISRLMVVVPATSVQLYTGGLLVTNSSLAPSSQGSQVRLVCQTDGGRPAPLLTWHVGNTRLEGSRLTNHSSVLHIKMTRNLLNKVVVCTVTSQADMQSRVLSASVSLDLNLSPVSTVITPELDREELVSGDTLQLLCQTEGARPAATIQWINTSASHLTELTKLTDHRTQQIATLQSDGTYVTLSKLVFTIRSERQTEAEEGILEN